MKELLMRNKKRFVMYLFGALLTATNGILFSLAITNGFSIIQAQDSEEIRYRIILVIIFGLAPVFIQVFSRYLRIGFMRDVLIEVRHLVYQKIMRIPIEKFKLKRREDYMAMMVADINVFERDFFLSILNIISSFGSFIIGELILLWIHPLIALLVFFAAMLIFIITYFFEKPIRKAREETQVANANYTVQVSNILNGMEVIKLYQVEDKFEGPFQAMVHRLEKIKRKFKLFSETQWNLTLWVSNVFQVGMFIYATYLYIQGNISLSGMILVYNFLGQIIWANVNGFRMVNRYKAAIDIFNRITKQDEDEVRGDTFSLKEGIDIENLNYAYGEKAVLTGINLNIPKGSKVLVYGPSGTGKTTFLNCLSQALSDYEGMIHYDKNELAAIQEDSFLKYCGYIRQSHFMFEASIKDNIVLNQAYDQEKLHAILKALDLWKWIDTLDEKEDFILEQNGNNISGGQRQRISIARELYRDSEVLFVDEPSASLDDETSVKVYDALMKLDRTMVIVSHRHLEYLKQRVDQVLNFNPEGGYSYEKVSIRA